MSVAFRRESDEEHLEPRFERPIPPGPNLVTPAGLALIEAEVARGEDEVPGLPDGDGKTAARRELRYWRQRLASAELVVPRASDEVVFGARVTLRMGGATRTLAIVGHDEADGAADKIGHTAPLARALLGGCVGDVVDLPGRPGGIEILAIAAG